MNGDQTYFKSATYRKDLEAALRGTVNMTELWHKNILITGATGLIGSFMVDLFLYANARHHAEIEIYALARDENRMRERFFSAPDKSGLHYIPQDVTEPLRYDIPAMYIIHAAGDGFPAAFREHPVETMTPALFGTYHLLRYVKEHPVKRFLYISSGEIYGKAVQSGRAFTEDDCGMLDCMDVRSCYPMAKRCGETLCASFGGQYHIPVTVARPSHIYGICASDRDNRAAMQFIRRAAAGEDIVLYSPGDQMRSYTYVADCVSGILTVLLNGADGEAYNIANASSRATIWEFAQSLSREASVRCVRREPDETEKKERTPITYAVLDSSKLERLGWQGQYDLGGGIKNMYAVRKELSGR